MGPSFTFGSTLSKKFNLTLKRFLQTSSKLNEIHTPVMADEALQYLVVKENGLYLDMTFGAGGHAKKILAAMPNVTLYGLDRDPTAYKEAMSIQRMYSYQLKPLLGKFSELPNLLSEYGIGYNSFDGIIMDLGVSSMQFDTSERGFMLSKEGPLDMRMDYNRAEQPTAADILAYIDEESLYKVLKYYGEEPKARMLAQAIIECRLLFKKLTSTKELADIVASLYGEAVQFDKLGRYSHPATKTFQALRILVNDELNELDFGLHAALCYLKPDGVLVTISYHSLEDIIIKRHFSGSNMEEISPFSKNIPGKNYYSVASSFSLNEIDVIPYSWKPLTKHVIFPTEKEIILNPRSRSAKFRVSTKQS